MRDWPWKSAPADPRAPKTTEQLLATQRAKVSWQRGLAAQEQVGYHLRLLGIACLWRVHTGTKKVRGKRAFTGKVEGDWRGVLPSEGGRAVLCEVKARPDVLSLSDFQLHQLRALQEHHAARGLALVGWVRGTDVAVMRWPLDIAKHRPLQWEAALALRLDLAHRLAPAPQTLSFQPIIPKEA